MKKALVSGYIGFDNFGDEAIFLALSKHLKENNIDVSVLCSNKETVEKKYDVKTYAHKCPLQIIKAILNNDILISGGGSLLQNKTSNFSLFYYLTIIFLAKIFFKKVVIFSQGIEPIKGKFQEFITKTILKMTDYISVRDEKSLNLLKSWGIEANLTSDPVYSLIQDEKISKNKKGLIVQLRKSNLITKDFIQKLAKIVSDNYKDEIKVFSFQESYDKEICLDFIEELKKYNIQTQYISQKTIEETIDIINNAKFVISTRFHGVLISNALETKTFALCYDEKVKNIGKELNIENIDLFDFTFEELKLKLEDFFVKNKKQQSFFRRYEWEKLDNWINNIK